MAAAPRSPAEVSGPLGSLALSQVRPHSATAALRAARWHADLVRLGVVLPLFVVHDLGLVLATGREQYALEPRCPEVVATAAAATAEWRALLDEARESETARRALELGMTDDGVTVVLASLLRDVAQTAAARAPVDAAVLPLDAALFERLLPQPLAELWRRGQRGFEAAALAALAEQRLLVLTLVDALDLDTLRLFGMLGQGTEGALAQVELLASLEMPECNDVVNFSLEILPSVLETRTQPGAGTTPGFGYDGLGLRGSIDSLVLTELAWDDHELARRMIENEALYYAREVNREDQRRVHYLLVDASASMRGDRATFARALALATGKKLLLTGDDVVFRFFDSRLYEPHAARAGELPTAHILSFRGERGRNPARVFTELASVLELARGRDPRQPVVHLFTHAALYIPRELVGSIVRLAQLAAVFIRPSGGVPQLDYLDLLTAHWIVDHGVLGRGSARADAARSILDATGKRPHAGDAAPASRRGATSELPPSSRRMGLLPDSSGAA
ncbi:MAG: hypothetical protein HY908_01670 [Myxococcales bacterium]|nr:hypothetical protein [Myxococcales bacterium]